jgi:sporulation protein YabP
MDQMSRKPAEIASAHHQVTMTNRSLMGVDGVVNMDSYDQDRIILQTGAGLLEVKGAKLHVQQLNLEQGKIVLDGEIDSLVYCGESARKRGKNFLGRLVK